MKSKRIAKFVSAVTSLTLMFSAAVPTWASEPELPVNYLETSRMEGEKLPVNEDGTGKNVVYMGTIGANVSEGDAIYEFTLYREGDLSEQAGVTVKSMDLMAVYGKDYELLPDNTGGVEYTGDGVSLLEKSVKNALKEEQSPAQDSNWLAEKTTEFIEDASASDEDQPSLNEEPASDGESQLTDEQKSLVNGVMSEETAKAMQNVDSSSCTEVVFEPGESEKQLRFRIFDDTIPEGSEGFSLILSDAWNAVAFENTYLSVSINDNEPVEHSKVSFSDSNYIARNGKAVLTVKRKGALYSLCDLTLVTSGSTAVAGEDYEELNGILTFMPYETEKNVEINTPGSGRFNVLMSGFNACEEGGVVSADVVINNPKKAIEESGSATLMGSESGSFNINLDNRNYSVEYTMPADNNLAPKEANIIDYAYKPPLEVGKYYFATDDKHGGGFVYGHTFGDKPNRLGTLTNEYIFDSKNRSIGGNDDKYGKLEYYSTVTWQNGGASTDGDKLIPAVYYQFLSPDWWQTSSFGSGPESQMDIYYTATYNNSNKTSSVKKKVTGDFGRNVQNGAMPLTVGGGNNPNIIRDDIRVRINSMDYNSGGTPKSYMRFYGIAAMYKKYNVRVESVSEKTFRTGSGDSTISVVPAQVHITSGAQTVTVGDVERNFYANVDPEKSKMIISLDSSLVNGKTGVYGDVTGHTIKIGTGDSQVSLNYPADYVNWLNSVRGQRISQEVNMTSEVVDSIINNVQNTENLLTIPYDKYFIHWIDGAQKSIIKSGSGYYQTLTIKPQIAYKDVSVEVRAPNGQGQGAFNDTSLTPGATLTYHAGDMIDLSASAADPDKYYVKGYEVSTDDGVKFNVITSTNTLFLEPGVKKYVIRPVIAEKDNCIELIFTENAAKYLQAAHVLQSSDLITEGDKEVFGGRNILYINPVKNPEDSTVSEKIEPVPGKVYPISFTCVEDDDYIYQPVIRHGNDTHTTNVYYVTAAADVADNILHVDVRQVKKSDLKKYDVSGYLTGDYYPVRNDGLQHLKMPVDNYLVSAGKGTQIVSTAENTSGQIFAENASSVSLEDGRYTLSDICGQPGDILPVLVSNGITDEQIVDITLPENAEKTASGNYSVEAGETELDYPYNAPKITSLSYEYGKMTNNAKSDNRRNQVDIYDDTFTVRSVVEKNGRNIEKALFTIYTATGLEGETYEAKPVSSGSNVYTFDIPNMTTVLHAGDRLKVRLVDSESGTMTNDDGSTVNVGYEYPAVDTGLLFQTSNELIKPQTFDFPNSMEVDIPLIGKATGMTKSGLITLSRSNWGTDQGNGYTIMFNLNALYDTRGTLSAPDKSKKANDFINTVEDTIAKEAKKEEKTNGLAEQTIAKEAGKNLNQDDVNAEKKTMEDIAVTQKGKSSQNPYAGYNSRSHSVDIAFILAFDFIYHPEREEYVFMCGAVAAGGTYTFNTTWYFSVYGVPLFLNLTATIQGDVMIYYPTAEGKDALSEGDFESYSGNIANVLEKVTANMSLMFKGKIQVGVGLCGVVSSGGFVGLSVQFDMELTDPEKTGVKLDASGGIAVDLLIAKLEISVAEISYGAGTLEGASYSFFGGLMSGDLMSGAGWKLSEIPDESLTTRSYNMGTTDLSRFGNQGIVPNLEASPEAVSRKVLLDNASEHTRPQILPLSDDGSSRFMVFIGNNENRSDPDDLNSATLYYSTYDPENGWHGPMAVADDGTFDTTPEIMKVGNKVIIAWSDAGEQFNPDETLSEKLNKLGISLAVYDINTGTMIVNAETGSPEIPLVTNDGYFNLSPQLSVHGSDIYCSYMKRDITGVESDRDLIDMSKLKSDMAYVKYDSSAEKRSEETLIPTLEGHTVFDFNSEISGDYLAAVYTVDVDNNLQTGEDRELYLELLDLKNKDNMKPYIIQITDDSTVTQSNPKLTLLDGELYMTWLSDGYKFNIMHLTDEIVAKEDTVYAEIKENNPSIPDSINTLDVLAAYAGKKGLNGLDSRLGDGKGLQYHIDSADFKQTENQSASIGPYTVTSDGQDIYVFYTNSNPDPESTGQEIFGIRYSKNRDADASESSGFGKAVQITDDGKVIDELDLFMTEDDNVYAVSNYYEQWIDENGHLNFGANQLSEIGFEPASSLKVSGDLVTFPFKLKAGDTDQLVFDVLNDGLIDADGCHVEVTELNNGSGKVIFDKDITAVIKAGCTETMTIPWTIPDNVSETSIIIKVTEHNVVNPGTYTTPEIKIPYETKPEITNVSVLCEEGSYVLRGEIKNNGNKPMSASKLSVMLKNDLDAGKPVTSSDANTFAEVDIKPLDSGETYPVEINMSLRPDDFNEMGCVNLRLALSDDEKETNGYTRIVSSKPVVAEINDGQEHLELNGADNVTKLSVKAGPWNSLAGDVKFYSADNRIATVDSNGNITPAGNGTTMVYAYYPSQRINDGIEVTVTGIEEKPLGPSGGGGTATAGNKIILPDTISHGSVSANVNQAKAGEQVTITVNPEEGYRTAEVNVTDGNGNAVKVIDNGDGTYTFTMPDTSVTVTPGFEKDGGTACPRDDTCPITPFTDTDKNEWYHDGVHWAIEKGIMNGTGENTFEPLTSTTRAMIVTMLWRMEGSPQVDDSFTFTDVPDGQWYTDAVKWAAANDIVTGYNEDEFSPADQVTREQIVTILYRYAQFKGADASGGETAYLNGYTDARDIAGWAVNAFRWAVDAGIILGMSDTILSPKTDAVRAQVATILMRFSKMLQMS